MKYLFPTILLVSIFCVTGDVAAKAQHEHNSTIFETIKSTFNFSPKAKSPKPPINPDKKTSLKESSQPTIEKTQATQEQKLAAVAAVKSMQEIINETTNKDDKAKFGIAAMVKAFREQAANNNNPQKNLFAQDLQIGEQLLAIQGNDLKQATALAAKLTPETQRLLKEALERRYSVFTRLGALKDFVNSRELTAA
jgi:hypothetical protein